MRRLILLLIAVSLSLRVAAADSETEVVSVSQIDLSANEREYLIAKQQYTQLLNTVEELEQRLKATVDTKTSLVELKRSGQEIAVLSLQIKDLIQRLDNLYAQLEADKSPVLNESRLVIAHLGVNPIQGSSSHVTSLAADQRFFGNLVLAGGAQVGEIAIVLEIRQAESGEVLARKAVTRQNRQPTQLQEFWELVPGELPANQSLELNVIARAGKANPISGEVTFELVSPEPLEADSDQTIPKLVSKRGDETATDGTDGDDSWCQVIKAAEEGDGNNFIRCSPRFIEFCTDSYGCTAFERDDLTTMRHKAFEESRLDDLTSKIYEEWEEMAELISFRVVQRFQTYGSQPAGESSYLNLSSEAKGCLADVSESGEQLMSRIRNISKREIESFLRAKQAAQATSDIPFVASFDESTLQTSWAKRADKIRPFTQDLISFVLRPSVEEEWQYYRQSHVSTCGCITRVAQALYSLDIMTADTFDTIRENSLRLGCRDLFYYLH